MASKTDDRVTLESDRDTKQKLKVLASLEAQTMQEWLAWMVDRAYKAKIVSKKSR